MHTGLSHACRFYSHEYSPSCNAWKECWQIHLLINLYSGHVHRIFSLCAIFNKYTVSTNSRTNWVLPIVSIEPCKKACFRCKNGLHTEPCKKACFRCKNGLHTCTCCHLFLGEHDPATVALSRDTIWQEWIGRWVESMHYVKNFLHVSARTFSYMRDWATDMYIHLSSCVPYSYAHWSVCGKLGISVGSQLCVSRSGWNWLEWFRGKNNLGAPLSHEKLRYLTVMDPLSCM
jgi:hypothetical protein